MANATLTGVASSSATDGNTTSEVTASLAWNSGDWVFALATSEDASTVTFGTPTFTGGTFVLVQAISAVSGKCGASLWKCQAGSAGPGAVTVTHNTKTCSFTVWAWGNSLGIGNITAVDGVSVLANGNTNQTITINAGSGMCLGYGEFNAETDVTVTTSPGLGTQVIAAVSTGFMTTFTYHWVPAVLTPGSVSAGFGTTISQACKFSGFVFEVLGSTAAGKGIVGNPRSRRQRPLLVR